MKNFVTYLLLGEAFSFSGKTAQVMREIKTKTVGQF